MKRHTVILDIRAREDCYIDMVHVFHLRRAKRINESPTSQPATHRISLTKNPNAKSPDSHIDSNIEVVYNRQRNQLFCYSTSHRVDNINFAERKAITHTSRTPILRFNHDTTSVSLLSAIYFHLHRAQCQQ